MLGKFVIAGFEVIIGLIFVMYALGPFYISLKLMPAGSEVLAIVVFFVGVASFAGIPVLIKKVAKGIKLFVIISVIQIGTIICCFIADSPDVGRSILLMCVTFSTFVLVFLAYSYMKKRRWDV